MGKRRLRLHVPCEPQVHALYTATVHVHVIRGNIEKDDALIVESRAEAADVKRVGVGQGPLVLYGRRRAALLVGLHALEAGSERQSIKPLNNEDFLMHHFSF